MAAGLSIYNSSGYYGATGKDIRVAYSDGSFTDIWSEGRQGVRATYSNGTYEDIYWDADGGYDYGDWQEYSYALVDQFYALVTGDDSFIPPPPLHAAFAQPARAFSAVSTLHFPSIESERIVYWEHRITSIPDYDYWGTPWVPLGGADHAEYVRPGWLLAIDAGPRDVQYSLTLTSATEGADGGGLACTLEMSGWAPTGFTYQARGVLESGRPFNFDGYVHVGTAEAGTVLYGDWRWV